MNNITQYAESCKGRRNGKICHCAALYNSAPKSLPVQERDFGKVIRDQAIMVIPSMSRSKVGAERKVDSAKAPSTMDSVSPVKVPRSLTSAM